MQYYSPFSEIHQFPSDNYLKYAKPFWIRHQAPTSDTVVICLHGFTATTYETSVLSEPIFESGFDVAGILFPAHGLKNTRQARVEMNQIQYQDLLTLTRETIAQAHELYRNVYIYGQSMGGAIALIMAEEGIVDSCALTAPALQINPIKSVLIHLLAWTGLIIKDENHTEFFNESYGFTSIHAAFQVIKLAKIARKGLKQITCPLLVCHSQKDETVDPKVVHWIATKSCGPTEIAWFNDSGHTMALDVEGKAVIARVVSFFKNL